MKTQSPHRAFVSVIALLTLLLLACDVGALAGTTTKPTAIITAPPSGARVNAGSELEVQSVATDAQGITRIELWVDGAVVKSDALPAPQASYTSIQRWTATTPGAHTIQVRAYNSAGAASEPAAISVEVIAAAAQATAPTPTNPAPTIPAPTAPLPPAPSPIAPAVPTSILTAPSPIAPAAPTPIPTAPQAQPAPPPACPSPPVIASFAASPTTITTGQTSQLSWGAVTNATSVTIDPGIGGVATPGSRDVNPNTTTTYTLTAVGCGGAVTQQVTVIVQPAPPTCPGAPQITAFAASPAEITEGQSATLSWATTNASKVEINQAVGQVGASGTRVVSPKTTTGYALTVTGCDGTGTMAQIVVTVKSASPVVHSSKDLEIKQTWVADLDEGILGASHIADLFFRAVTANEMYLEAANGAKLSFIGASDGNPARCQGNLAYTNRIPINDLQARTFVCYTTNQARPGMFRVKATGIDNTTGARVIVINYTTWEK